MLTTEGTDGRKDWCVRIFLSVEVRSTVRSTLDGVMRGAPRIL